MEHPSFAAEKCPRCNMAKAVLINAFPPTRLWRLPTSPLAGSTMVLLKCECGLVFARTRKDDLGAR